MSYIHRKNTKLLSLLDNFEIQGGLKHLFIKPCDASINLDKNPSTAGLSK